LDLKMDAGANRSMANFSGQCQGSPHSSPKQCTGPSRAWMSCGALPQILPLLPGIARSTSWPLPGTGSETESLKLGKISVPLGSIKSRRTKLGIPVYTKRSSDVHDRHADVMIVPRVSYGFVGRGFDLGVICVEHDDLRGPFLACDEKRFVCDRRRTVFAANKKPKSKGHARASQRRRKIPQSDQPSAMSILQLNWLLVCVSLQQIKEPRVLEAAEKSMTRSIANFVTKLVEKPTLCAAWLFDPLS